MKNEKKKRLRVKRERKNRCDKTAGEGKVAVSKKQKINRKYQKNEKRVRRVRTRFREMQTLKKRWMR